MIDATKALPGLHVFYQRPHMRTPEYGLITSANSRFVFVRFDADADSTACRPDDLFWPPDYCSADDTNPDGQPFSRPEEMPNQC